MLELLIDGNQIKKNENAFVYFEWFFLYLSSLDGVLRSDLVYSFIRNSITIVHGRNVKIYATKSDKVEVVSGVFYFDNGFDVELGEHVQVLIVRRQLFDGYCSIPKNLCGVNRAIHGCLISTIFESMRRVGAAISNGAVAIAHLVAISILENSYNILDDGGVVYNIYNIISSHYKDVNFSLDDLCNMIFMSRRKVQYMLSRNGWTFTTILRMYRVNALKQLLHSGAEALTSRYIEFISYKSGYESLEKANRDFKKIEGVTIRAYIKA